MAGNYRSQQDGKNNKRIPRRHYVINAAFQWKYCVTVAVVVFLASSIISSVLYGILHHQARMRLLNPMTYTAQVPWVIFAFALGFAALTAAGVGIWSVFMTHRICGPLVLLRNYVAELSEGRIPDVRPLRRKDEFKELMASFAKAVSSLKTSKQAEVAALSRVLDIARQAIEDDACDRKTALVAVASHIEPLRNAVESSFDVAKRHDRQEEQVAGGTWARDTVSVG